MSLLGKLKSLLGLQGESKESQTVGVTVERDPDQDRASPSAESSGTTSGGGSETGDGGVSAGTSPESTRSRATVDDGDSGTAGTNTGESSAGTSGSSRARAEADETTGTAPAEPADGTPVVEIKGVGDAYAERLGNAGIEYVEQLADADPETLAKQTDISEGRLENWIERARNR